MENFFEDLEMPITEDESAIKKAYAAQLRRYHPEKNPEGFQRIRRAYEVLSNRTSREEHIAYLQHGDRVNQLIEEAKQAFDEEKLVLCGQLLSSVLELSPNLRFPRLQLARILLAREQYQEAIPHLEHAREHDPEDALPCLMLADAYKGLGQTEREEQTLLTLLQRQPGNESAAIHLATLYYNEQARVDADRVLEQCIAADGMEDIQDTPCLLRLVLFRLADEQPERADVVFRRVLAIVGDAEADRHYAARECMGICHMLHAAGRQDLAVGLLEYALLLRPDDEELRGFQKSLHVEMKNNRIEQERQRLKEDRSVTGPFAHLADYLRFEFDDSETAQRQQAINDELGQWIKNTPREVIQAIQRFKTEYPALYERHQEVYDVLWDQACERIDSISAGRQVLKPTRLARFFTFWRTTAVVIGILFLYGLVKALLAGR